MSIDFNVFQFASLNNCWFDENGLLHVRGIKKNKEINYKCPFCYETYNKDGNPRKNSKNFTHIHGIDDNISKNDNEIETSLKRNQSSTTLSESDYPHSSKKKISVTPDNISDGDIPHI